ncbi:hypothetical protein AGDE_15466 [Angomonas deanei]|uniref:Uncharacterized protein n=1 Tax=Angomonas deanei TaxID=59799 RepID=A0A7G2CS82_9TRYP|nr:hypothetical protein AGDE_15466 [Angomonas deanei]CAD2222600.1 hypothetical protein, conserved [Angomonas deanei]|eukprot:EPY19016.1 hypothetical protein AGDE_15466 [Angomonas deanei]
MIACKEDYAEAFLLQLYTILTGKKVTPAAPLASPAVEPQPFDPSTVPPLRESPTRLGDLFSDVGENSDREPLPSASLSVEEKEASFGMNSDGHASLRGPPPPRARGSVHESPQRMQQETAGIRPSACTSS